MMTAYLRLHKGTYRFRRLLTPTQWTHFGDPENAPAGCHRYYSPRAKRKSG